MSKKEQEDVEQIVSFKENSLVVIDFKGLLNEDLDEELTMFSLEKKRVYKNLYSQIIQDLEYFIERTESLKFSLLSVKHKIITKLGDYSEKEFSDDVLAIFDNEDIVTEIHNYVEENYSVNLNERSQKAKNVNTELQFKDDHAKIIIKSSVAQRLVIPLITDYILYYYEKEELKGSHKQDEKLTMGIFTRIIELFSPEDEQIDIFNKLFRFTSSRVLTTRGSDKVIWAYLKNMSKDIDSVIRQLFRSLVITVIPKLLVDANIISFFHVVLNKSINFLFTYNYNVKYRPVSRKNVDSEGLSEFDRMEINMVRFDEGQAVINKVAIRYEIENIKKKYGIEIDPDEFEYYKENVEINSLQTNLLFLMFSKDFGYYNSLFACNYNQYITLCIIARKILEQKGFTFLSKFITSVPETDAPRKKLNKNREFLNRLTNSKKYEDIFYKKYNNVVLNLVNSGLLIQFITTLKNHPFYAIPDFFSDEDEMEMIEEPIELIADELMDFVLLI